jgi:hypothetical protein
MEKNLKHNKKIMISKGGLNAIGFATCMVFYKYFVFIQNNTPNFHCIIWKYCGT